MILQKPSVIKGGITMFEIDEIEEVVEIEDSNSNTGYTYTSEEIWKMGREAIKAMVKKLADTYTAED